MWPGWGVGGVYSLCTMSMLYSLITATLVVEHARDTAILIWSLSAAFWADCLCVREVGWEFCECLLHFIAFLYKSSMLPASKQLMRSDIVCWIDLSSFCALVVGAKMSISKCKRSHQKGDVVWFALGVMVYAVARHLSTAAWRVWNLALFRGRWWMCFRHVLRKSGGSCWYVVGMKVRPWVQLLMVFGVVRECRRSVQMV